LDSKKEIIEGNNITFSILVLCALLTLIEVVLVTQMLNFNCMSKASFKSPIISRILIGFRFKKYERAML